jgi:ABC-type transport system involved in multi-copper enzyme maturation permease subunit
MMQTLAIFHDAFRELRAKRMFWIVMILTAMAVGAFALVGVNAKGVVTIAAWELPIPFPGGALYKLLFTQVLIEIWLTWAATILALISTAGIFPDFVAGGSVDLYLSKPISRLRLFLTKYATGLVFVTIQVSLFSILGFIVMRVRGKTWEPGLFLAIPIVVCFFSYLYSAQVLFGLLTRSTTASLLLSLLVWLLAFVVYFAEIQLASHQTVREQKREAWIQRANELDRKIKALEAKKVQGQPDDPWLASNRAARDNLTSWVADGDTTIKQLRFFHRLVHAVMAVAPKTSQTIGLLEHRLLSRDEMSSILDAAADNRQRRRHRVSEEREIEQNDLKYAQMDIERSPSLGWVLGTSLGFEAVMLTLAAWIFCRRDY